jgi:hypothetical protein
LFHYFGSKKDLYDTMVVFVIHTLYDEIVTHIIWDEPDLFERIKQLAVIKLAYSQMYPHMFDFMLQTLTYKKAGNTEKILDLYKDYGLDLMQLSKDIYVKNIDYSKFSDPSTVAESAKIVSWTLEKFSEETLAALRTDGKLDLGKAVDGMNRYMAILKNAFYK